ncbi:hypothetical protein CYANOKiyG1_38590 [Okeania sp. KiyG1]|nr:hypothetical protein CYANOKiyG1_38590 [Okeania sp. KiyG1]
MAPVQESGGERITKMTIVMTIEDFFYVQLNGFDITSQIKTLYLTNTLFNCLVYLSEPNKPGHN